MLNRLSCIFLSVLFIIISFTGCQNENTLKIVTRDDFSAEELDCSVYDLEKYTTPFWEGNIVYNEFVYPIMDKNDELSPFQLMYYADDIISVKDTTLEHTYIEGVDYILEDGKLVVLPEGNIRVKMQEDIHQTSNPYNYPINYMYPHRDGSGYEYWNDQDIFNKTLVVTYIHNDKWNNSKPASKTDKLPNIMKKLENGENATIVVTGDSISVGYNSSRIMAAKPYTDGYALMTVKALREKYHNNIKFVNTAVGGSVSSFNEEQLYNDILVYSPDLVIIAYGMNDASVNMTAEEYKSNINGRIEYIKKNLPDCDILLVTSFVANPWVFDIELYKEHAAELRSIESEWDNVAVCDPQSIQLDLMENKEFLCFMGDNLMHPNDYGMRIISQCVLAALS